MPWVTPTNVNTGDVLTASKWNQEVVSNSIALPRGIVSYASVTANQTVTTETDLTGLTLTWTASSARIYRTTIFLNYAEQQGAAGYAEVKLTDGANTQKQTSVTYLLQNHGDMFICTFVESGLSGSTTRKARALTSAGSLVCVGGATRPMQIVVEDLGAV